MKEIKSRESQEWKFIFSFAFLSFRASKVFCYQRIFLSLFKTSIYFCETKLKNSTFIVFLSRFSFGLNNMLQVRSSDKKRVKNFKFFYVFQCFLYFKFFRAVTKISVEKSHSELRISKQKTEQKYLINTSKDVF